MVKEKTPEVLETSGVQNTSVLGMDVGATKILIGIVTPMGEVLGSQRYIMDRSSQAQVLNSIEAALTHFMGTWQGPEPLALGAGVVGHTKPASGLWVRAMNLPILSPVPLSSFLRKSIDRPVVIDNDVHAATLAEMRWGIGKETGDFIYLNIGTGLAAGMVCNGKLVRGTANYAGEVGHMVVEPGGMLCTCGQRGCLEPICSGDGILAQVRAGLREYPDSTLFQLHREGDLRASQVFQAAEAGDRLASKITGKAVWALSTAMVNLVNILNPAAIVYGGGVVRDGWLMGKVSEFVSANALVAARRAIKGIWPSRLDPEQVGLLGAASLAWKYLEKKEQVY